MLGTALQYGGEDQLYIPMKARKNQNQNQNQRKKTQKDKSEDSVSKSDFVDSENRNLKESSCCPSVELGSNIDRFLESTTPLVPAQYFSKVHLICLFFSIIMNMVYCFSVFYFCFVRLTGYDSFYSLFFVCFSVCNCCWINFL